MCIINVKNRNVIFFITYFAIIIFAFWAKIHLLDLRPFHHDEGVNHFFIQQMNDLGFYRYSHKNYHGPLYFYVTWFFVYLFGDSENSFRMSSVVFGTGLIALPLMLRSYLGNIGTIVAQLLLLSSASVMYMSRYAIHETAFVFFSVLLAFSLFRYGDLRKSRDLFLIALAAACLMSLKETYIITFFVFFLAFLVVFVGHSKNLIPNKQNSLIFLTIYFFILMLFYTGFFQWSGGIIEFFKSVPQWLGRNDSDVGHFKPWGYYLSVIFGSNVFDYFDLSKAYWRKVDSPTEPGILAVLIFLPLVALKNKKLPYLSLGVFLFVWSLLIFVIYSVPVKYKTIWLIINLTVPLYLFLAWQFSSLFSAYSSIPSKAFLVLIILSVLIFNTQATLLYSYQEPVKNNPFAYVHSTEGVREVAKDLIQITRKKEGRILIAVKSYWPLPYYLKIIKDRIVYSRVKRYESDDCEKFSRNYRVILMDKNASFDCQDWVSKYYRIAANTEIKAWVREN